MANQHNRGHRGNNSSSWHNRQGYSGNQPRNQGNWDENQNSAYDYGNSQYNQGWDRNYPYSQNQYDRNFGQDISRERNERSYYNADSNHDSAFDNRNRSDFGDRGSNPNRSHSNFESSGFGSVGSRFSSDFDRHNRGQQSRGSFWDDSNEGTTNRFREESQQGQGRWNNSESSHRGKGPKGYQRSDDRIREDINDRLSDHHSIDASDIEVSVSSGEVTLTGTVSERREKRLAEDIADSISGVKNVENKIRLQQQHSDSSESSKEKGTGYTNGKSKLVKS